MFQQREQEPPPVSHRVLSSLVSTSRHERSQADLSNSVVLHLLSDSPGMQAGSKRESMRPNALNTCARERYRASQSHHIARAHSLSRYAVRTRTPLLQLRSRPSEPAAHLTGSMLHLILAAPFALLLIAARKSARCCLERHDTSKQIMGYADFAGYTLDGIRSRKRIDAMLCCD